MLDNACPDCGFSGFHGKGCTNDPTQYRPRYEPMAWHIGFDRGRNAVLDEIEQRVNALDWAINREAIHVMVEIIEDIRKETNAR